MAKLTVIKERSIPFNSHTVNSILEGRKTVFRSPVKGAAAQWLIDHPPEWVVANADQLCRLGKPGDRLWVKEDTEAFESPCGAVMLSRYVADKEPVLLSGCSDPNFNGSVSHWGYPRRWRPAARMPTYARRILLEITSVRIERLQAISDEQCIAEGIIPVKKDDPGSEELHQFWRDYRLSADGTFCVRSPRESFQSLWRYNNGWSFPKGALLEQSSPNCWDANPWVWVVAIRRIEQTADSQ